MASEGYSVDNAMSNELKTAESSDSEAWKDYYQLQSSSLPDPNIYLPPLSEDLKQRLDILVDVAELLGIDDLSFSSYSSATSQLLMEPLSLARSLNQLKFVEEELRDHLVLLKHEHLLLMKWKETAASERDTGESAPNIERRREALLKKAKEYHNELKKMLAERPDIPITITEFTKQQEKNRIKEQEIKAKEAKIKAFQGLPPNLDLARHELRNARSEQMKLIQLRERLLGRMAESVS